MKMENERLWQDIKDAQDPLSKFRRQNEITACIYPSPYNGISEVVRWFYSRNNGCQVFFSCSKAVSDKIDAESWADVSDDFTQFVEHELMPFCVHNTDWDNCARHGVDYDKKLSKSAAESVGCDFGCAGSSCPCEPFGEGDFTYGIAEASEFNLEKKPNTQQ